MYLLNISISELDGGAECTLRFADYTKLGEVADKPLVFLPSRGTLIGWKTRPAKTS